MLRRENKNSQIEKLSQGFAKSKACFLINCIGLNVEKMTGLRKSLKLASGDLQVIRNSLSLLAMKKHATLKTACKPLLEGPNAYVLAFKDTAKVAKIIDEFADDNPIFKIKLAILDGKTLSSGEVKTLAKLPGIEVLKSNLLSVLSAPLTRFLATLKETQTTFVRLLKAKK